MFIPVSKANFELFCDLVVEPSELRIRRCQHNLCSMPVSAR